MPTWYLVRHGETEFNAEGRLQGHTDVPISPRGRGQARMVAKRIAEVPFVAAYASDLARTVETARLALDGRDIPLHLRADLRERSVGEWQGVSRSEIQSDQFSRFRDGDAEFAPPGGESMSALAQRAKEAHQSIAAGHGDDDDVLIVSHGYFLRVLAIVLLHLPIETNGSLLTDNASVSIIRHTARGIQLGLWNDTSHLGGLEV